MYVAALVVTDFVAGSATSLFSAYHFNRLPTFSLIANLGAVPINGIWIMPAGLAGLLLMPLGLEQVPFQIMGVGVGLINDMAETVAAWPGAQIHTAPMPAAIMCLAALGGIFICIWKGRWRWLGLVLVVPAIGMATFARSPDLLVDESARVFAVSGDDGRLVFKPGRVGRFVKEVWSDRYGGSEGRWPASGAEHAELGLRCDGDGCIYQRSGTRVLIAFTANAVAEDCGNTDVIVSAIAAYDLCLEGAIFDIVDFRRDGTHAFWIEDGLVRVRSAVQSAGDRFWTRTD